MNPKLVIKKAVLINLVVVLIMFISLRLRLKGTVNQSNQELQW